MINQKEICKHSFVEITKGSDSFRTFVCSECGDEKSEPYCRHDWIDMSDSVEETKLECSYCGERMRRFNRRRLD